MVSSEDGEISAKNYYFVIIFADIVYCAKYFVRRFDLYASHTLVVLSFIQSRSVLFNAWVEAFTFCFNFVVGIFPQVTTTKETKVLHTFQKTNVFVNAVICGCFPFHLFLLLFDGRVGLNQKTINVSAWTWWLSALQLPCGQQIRGLSPFCRRFASEGRHAEGIRVHNLLTHT